MASPKIKLKPRTRAPKSAAVTRTLAPHRPQFAAVTASARVLAFDLSLQSTGYAYRSNGEVYTGTIKTKTLRGFPRIWWAREEILKVVEYARPTLITIEDYAIHAPGRVHDKAEFVGSIKLRLWELGYDALMIPPKSLKIAIAENGNAKKPEMAAAIERRFNFTIDQDDEADAFGLFVIGEYRCGLTTLLHSPRNSAIIQSISGCEIVRGRLQLTSNRRAGV